MDQKENFSIEKLDMKTTVGSSFAQTRKEALITIIAYLIWGGWGIAIAGIFGFADNLSYMWGMPTWITLGVVVPIFTIIIWLGVYLKFIYKD